MTIKNRRSAHLRLSLFACIVAACAVIPARATIMQFLEVEDLTRLSSDIFHGQIVSVETVWNAEHTRIYTKVRLRVDEALKGSTRRSEIITITQLGGERDGIKIDYAGRPEFSQGESVVLFTTPGKSSDFTVVALKQGKMHVAGSEVTRDFSGITLVDPKSRGKNLQTLSIKSTRLTLDELRTRIARTR